MAHLNETIKIKKKEKVPKKVGKKKTEESSTSDVSPENDMVNEKNGKAIEDEPLSSSSSPNVNDSEYDNSHSIPLSGDWPFPDYGVNLSPRRELKVTR